MKLLLLIILISFNSFSQNTEDINTDKLLELFIKENTVSNLMKFKGHHSAKSVEEYKNIGNRWILIKRDTTSSEINYYDYYLTFKRSHFKDPLIRYLVFEGYSNKEGFYFYSSEYGIVHIYRDFEKVVLFDRFDENNNPTNKFIFNF